MCGIAIAIGIDQREVARAMCSKMGHRGLRTGETHSYNNFIHICHTRLPIQGTSEEFDHPYITSSADGFLVGEIFNFKKLDPEAKTDLSVMVDFYNCHGPKAFEMFDGFWSAVIVDKQYGFLNIFLDDLGKKPLYMRTVGDCHYIASEIKALILPGILPPLTFDEVYFGAVYKFGYCIENRTPFKEIAKIPANTRFRVSINPPLKYDYSRMHSSYKRSPLFLRESLEEAVLNRLVSDVPISLLVSGGLDSSIIYKLVEKQTHDFTLFHVDNEEEEFLNFLNIPSDVKVKKLELPPQTEIPEILFWNETPVDLGSVLPQYALAKAIKKEGLHVALSGDGADELFGGYRRAVEYDTQESDIYHELVFYHLPRLDKLMMSQTIELRSPFLSRKVLQCALGVPWEKRSTKEFLKETFSDIIPQEILVRRKVPLKIKGLQGDPMKWRKMLISEFRGIHKNNIN